MPEPRIEHIPYTRMIPELLTTVLPRPRLVRRGWPRIAALFGLAALFGWLSARPFPAWLGRFFGGLARVSLGSGLVTAYVYRDPRREPLGNAPDYIYAPADGTILKIEEVADEPLFIKGPAYRLLITSQPLDVAVIRTPLPGLISYIHRDGAPQGPTTVGIKAGEGRRLLLDFRPNPYKLVSLPQPLASSAPVELFGEAGQSPDVAGRLGVRGFGVALLTTLYLPQEGIDILCRTSQHTQAGMTVLGRIKPGGAS